MVPMIRRVPIGRNELDPLRHVLTGRGGKTQLSALASRFLQALARRPGDVVERSALIDELWRGDYLVGEPALNRVVSETRRAVGDDPKNPALIQTVHRRGYRLVAVAAPEGGRLVEERWVKIWLLLLGSLAALAGVFALVLGMGLLARWVR
jgi:DNA-binding winged helix-turn-helix (wHTH) protein